MKQSFIFLITVAFLSCADQKTENPMIKVQYPQTRMDSIVENYHGTKIADPYRWLEADTSAETKAWVEAENKVTFDYLNKIPYRNEVKQRLEKLWNYEKYSAPFKEGGKYYYFKNDGLQNQSVLYVSDKPDGEGKVVLDPNTFSKDGTIALGAMEFSKDGKYLAYLLNEGGSDWSTGYVLDLATLKNTNDKLNWIKFSGISWKDDGFYYSRYPEPKGSKLSNKDEYHSLYYHKLGTDQKEDKLIFVDEDHAQRNVYSGVTEDKKFLIISTSESTSGNALSVLDLDKKDNRIINIITNFENDYNVVDNQGDLLYVLTNKNAPLLRLIAIDTKNPSEANWKEIIPQSNITLSSVSNIGGKLYASYMKNASSLIKVFDTNGKFIKDLDLPGIGTVGGISGKKDDTEAFYSYTSFTKPNTIYSLNTNDQSSKVFRAPHVNFKSDDYETKQEWYTSKDGTKVPMFITMKKGTKLDGTNPTLLYGYGGFDVPITPGFSVSRLPILENGGIYVVANIRGGGEFGKDWHKAGTLENKQNVFDDFIAAAEYLIANKYTSKEKLAIQGGSNGGLLVGACMTQRPDLFAVAFPAVGVLDMLRYHQFTIGWAWATDYGRSDDAKMFPHLLKYSPLHNVKEASYPATMITTADHDDRVVPAHSFKFAAELQKKQKGEKPVLIRIDTSAGHGAGKPTSKSIEEAADMVSFFFYNTNAGVKIKG